MTIWFKIIILLVQQTSHFLFGITPSFRQQILLIPPYFSFGRLAQLLVLLLSQSAFMNIGGIDSLSPPFYIPLLVLCNTKIQQRRTLMITKLSTSLRSVYNKGREWTQCDDKRSLHRYKPAHLSSFLLSAATSCHSQLCRMCVRCVAV